MALYTATSHPANTTPSLESTSQTYAPEMGLLLAGALAGTAMSRSARKQYRKMTRKATWKLLGMKVKSMLGFKKDVPDTVMGLDFWVFLLLVILGVALGAALFGLTGFLILLGIAVIIYLLLQG